MSNQENTSSKGRVREALRVLANARARKAELRHSAQNAGDVARARAHAATANIEARAAETKRDVQKRADEARVKATSRNR